MLTQTAELHFGGRAGIARVLAPKRTQSAIYQWGEVVPLAAARDLALLSGGAIGVDDGLYDQYGRIARKTQGAA
jgi:hypothetical protein